MIQQNPASPTPTATIDYDQGPSAAPILVPGDMDFHELCATTDIEDGMGKPFSVDGNHLAVFRYEDGYYACDNRCPHMGYPMHKGTLRDGVITCAWHRWEFDLVTGGCYRGACDDLRTYPVRVADGRIQVLVEKQAADLPALAQRLREAFNVRHPAEGVAAAKFIR